MHPKFKATLRRHQTKHLVEFDRRPQISERITGFVLDFNDSLILLHLLEWNTFSLNGYVVIRNQDISRYRAFDRPDYWQYDAAKRNKLKPINPHVSISAIGEAIASANKSFPLVAIEKELVADDEMWIGRPVAFTQKTVTIQGLTPSAEWIGEHRFKFDEITLVGFGDGYASALALSAKNLRKNSR